jgi:hypothetical protein
MTTLARGISTVANTRDVVLVFDDRTGRLLKRFPIRGSIAATKMQARRWTDERAIRTGRGALMVSPKINPVLTTGEKVMIGAVALGGLAALYYVFKPASTPPPPQTGSPAIPLNPIFGNA